ncbi:MAG: hypothetical protein M3P39_06350 [Actinomycetota bacterium]|nr:hypothetical protein [Actinomycetota bacterium]
MPLDWALVSENMPVLAAPRVPIPRRPAGALVARVAALAAGSFVAGAAALALLQRIGAPRARRRPGSVASRAFLVEIHLLGDRR